MTLSRWGIKITPNDPSDRKKGYLSLKIFRYIQVSERSENYEKRTKCSLKSISVLFQLCKILNTNFHTYTGIVLFLKIFSQRRHNLYPNWFIGLELSPMTAYLLVLAVEICIYGFDLHRTLVLDRLATVFQSNITFRGRIGKSICAGVKRIFLLKYEVRKLCLVIW